MKNISRLAALVLVPAALLCVHAREGRAATYRPAAATSPAGTVPNAINYQGRLVDNGFPVSGLRNVSFRLYDALVGPTNLLWSSGAQTVSVNQGLFGTTLAISTQALAGPAQKFLEVQVDAQVLSPREPLNAVPYALVAKSLEDNVSVSSVSVGTTLISSGTLSVASIQALNGSASFGILSPMIFSPGNKLGLGAANPASLLHMSSGTLTIDGNVVTALTTVGNVGIGLTGAIPNAKLQVANSVSAGPGSPDLIVGDGSPSAGNNTQVSIYRGAALGSYIGIDSYRSGAGAAPLILNGASGGSVGIGVTSFSPGALLDVDGTAQFGGVGTKSAFNGAGALTLANNAALTLSGANGNIVAKASVTASAFFGDGANLSNVPAVSVPASGVTAGTFQNAAYTFSNAVNLTGTSIWAAAGRLGVGTVNPTQKIHLSSGTLLIDGNTAASIQAVGSITAGSFSGPISGNATSATNLAGGAANQIPYQTGASATTFVAAPGANSVFFANGGAPSWTNAPTLAGTNFSGTAAGLNIGGNAATVTTNANLTGPVTSVGNATTIVSPLPALNGSALTNLTAANISAGTAGINISGTAATVTTNANLTGPVTSVGNATTIVSPLPALNGSALTNLTAANISAGTAGISISGNAATATSAVTATNVGGGSAGVIAFQSAANTTGFTPAGTAGQVLTSAGAVAGGPTWTTATNANTASAIVQRDASGNFSAGSITLAKAAISGINVVAFSATPTFDASLGNTQKITLTGNVTLSTLSNATAGQTLTFIICEDVVGGRTFAWPVTVKGATAITTTLSTCNAQRFIFDGTFAYATGAGVGGM